MGEAKRRGTFEERKAAAEAREAAARARLAERLAKDGLPRKTRGRAALGMGLVLAASMGAALSGSRGGRT